MQIIRVQKVDTYICILNHIKIPYRNRAEICLELKNTMLQQQNEI